jgi:hypothetical protein
VSLSPFSFLVVYLLFLGWDLLNAHCMPAGGSASDWQPTALSWLVKCQAGNPHPPGGATTGMMGGCSGTIPGPFNFPVTCLTGVVMWWGAG